MNEFLPFPFFSFLLSPASSTCILGKHINFHTALAPAVKAYRPRRCKGQMNAYRKYVEVHSKLDSGCSDVACGRRDKLRCGNEMLCYRSGYTSDIPLSMENQISYILPDTLDVRKRRGMWQIPNAVITLFAATHYSNQSKTAGIRDRPVHAPCAALTSSVLPRPHNFTCAAVQLLYNHALCNSEFC
jgi:hypothetical protein